MIWRSSLNQQDYMKHDVQPMTTKFSIRTGKAKTTNKERPSNDNLPTQSTLDLPVSSPCQLEQSQDTFSDQNNYEEDDSMDDNDEEDNQSGGQSSNDMHSNQVLFLNFTSDLSPKFTPSQKKPTTPGKKAAYRVNGVNILNRKNLDSKTAIERIQRRRENHNHVERRRRDTINNTIYELSQVVPNALQTGQKPHKGNILKATLDYILVLQAENQMYQARLAQTTGTTNIPALATRGNDTNTGTSSFGAPPPTPGSSTLPILPATPPPVTLSPLSPVSVSPSPDLIIPSLRMGGLEKTYGNTCRY
ncbi:hypothetical protein BC941DRAFT_427786 [Chlamydoabsidia padenii]|nr:hypothetical protein BC941DRAFT_427786 [Chlamydoabsidia padenii]